MIELRKALALAAVVFVAAACGAEEVPKLVVDTTSLPDVNLGAAYSAQLEVDGGQKPYMFAISTGSLPMGIELNSTTGAFGGIGGKAGRASFTVQVTDASKQVVSVPLSIYVVPDPLVIVTTVLPSGKEGTPYDQPLTASGGLDPLTWSLASGTLPAGVTIMSSGRVAGTPAEFGGFDFTVRVTDAENTARDQPLHITLTSLNPMVTTTTVAKGRVGEAYSATLRAEGGEPPYTWAVAAGSLPAGVALSANGELAGVPTESGTFTPMIRVNDSTSRMDTADITLLVIAPLAIETTQLPQALDARPYNFAMVATGGEPPYTWSLGAGGGPPAGITLGPNGVFQGMSAMLGDYPMTVRVQDSEGFRKSALFTLKVTDRFSYTITPATPIPATCSSTSVSYVRVPIEIPESFQIEDLDATIAVNYTWNPNNTRQHNVHDRTIGAPMFQLIAPDGTQAIFCGNGVDVPGGLECEARDLNRSYDDDGGQANRPERPFSAFDGMNAQGTWTFLAVIAEPSCALSGTIDSVTLSIRDDRAVTPYVLVTGYRKTNLITSPWVRICTPSCAGVDEHELFLEAKIWEVGPNGFPEGGAGDDIANPVPLTWSWQGPAAPGVTLDPDGHVTVADSGIRTCQDNNCFGTAQRTIVASGGGEVVTLTLRVVPPDWNVQNREY